MQSQLFVKSMLCALISIAAFAQSSPLGPDVAGGKDIPWLSRFTGSQLIGFQDVEFDQGSFYLPRKEDGYDPKKELDTAKPVVIEGKSHDGCT